MGGVVVSDQAVLPIQRDGSVDQREKLDPFLVAILLLAQAKDFAVGRVWEQSRGPGRQASLRLRSSRCEAASRTNAF
jgi:hypothetical protein